MFINYLPFFDRVIKLKMDSFNAFTTFINAVHIIILIVLIGDLYQDLTIYDLLLMTYDVWLISYNS